VQLGAITLPVTRPSLSLSAKANNLSKVVWFILVRSLAAECHNELLRMFGAAAVNALAPAVPVSLAVTAASAAVQSLGLAVAAARQLKTCFLMLDVQPSSTGQQEARTQMPLLDLILSTPRTVG
jgi:hypothetical protein